MGVHVIESADDFRSRVALAGPKLVVVDFFADWYEDYIFSFCFHCFGESAHVSLWTVFHSVNLQVRAM